MAPNRNKQGRFVSSPLDVTDDSKAAEAEALLHQGIVAIVLLYADWCGHCLRYKPLWEKLEKTPGRTANIIRVRDDMLSKIPTIAKAKIQGYPSVIKVSPKGKIEEYDVSETEKTNAVPFMRDMSEMKKELTLPPPPKDSGVPGPQSGMIMTGGFLAESVMGTLLTAVGPAALLLLGHSMLPRRSKTFKSPKRSSRRASTRRNRRH